MLIKKTSDNLENKGQADKDQLGLGISRSKFALFPRFKLLTRQIEKNFIVLPFWRNGYIWAAIISIIATNIAVIIFISRFYPKLPPEVPLIYDTVNERWDSFPRAFLYLIPIVLVIFGFLNIRLLQKVYYMNKRLTLMISLLIAVIFFLELIAVNELLIISTS
ncbi:hypothetical protein JW766_04730 [Candidatus Dojkabacteria bacterium]|nr:hypothetical protein [Candidatus Dojkabacteria bacterium]